MANPTIKHLGSKISISSPENDGLRKLSDKSQSIELTNLLARFNSDNRVIFNFDASISNAIINNDNGRVQRWMSTTGPTGISLTQDTNAISPVYLDENNETAYVKFSRHQYLVSTGNFNVQHNSFILAVAASVGEYTGNIAPAEGNDEEIARVTFTGRQFRIRLRRADSNVQGQPFGFRILQSTVTNPSFLSEPQYPGRPVIGQVVVTANRGLGYPNPVFTQYYQGIEYSVTTSQYGEMLNGRVYLGLGDSNRAFDGKIYQAVGISANNLTIEDSAYICRMLELKWGAPITRIDEMV